MHSLTLGRFREIDVKIHPSFGLIPLWVLYSWGTGDALNLSSLIFSVLMVIVVFGLVLAHEFGHSLMAKQHGLKVRDITLVPFGGVARIEQMPEQPRIEAMVAIAGPAVNLCFATLLLPVVLILSFIGDFESTGAVIDAGFNDHSFSAFFIFLFLVNLGLFIFNLLPVFPMDGGRLLRAGLTVPLGQDRATTTAVAVGIAGAGAMVIGGWWLGDWLLPLIGVFIGVAAWAEGRAARLETALRRMQVGPFTVWDRGGIAPGEPVTLALRGGLRDVVITEGNRVVGVAWRVDLLQALNTGRSQQPVSQIMQTSFATGTIEDSVYDLHKLMQKNNQWMIPIVEGDLYRGVFTADRFSQIYRQLKSQTIENRQIHRAQSAFAGLWDRYVR